jgi:hypothetical protein
VKADYIPQNVPPSEVAAEGWVQKDLPRAGE